MSFYIVSVYASAADTQQYDVCVNSICAHRGGAFRIPGLYVIPPYPLTPLPELFTKYTPKNAGENAADGFKKTVSKKKIQTQR